MIIDDVLTDGKTDLTDALFKIAARTICVMNIDVCCIWMKGERGILIPQVCCGIKAKTARFLFSEENYSIINYPLKENKPLQIRDLAKHSSERLKSYMEKEKLKSFLACPINIRGEKKGVIAVSTRDRYRRFTKADKMLLSTMADVAVFCLRIESLKSRVREDYLNTIKTIAHILEANDDYTYGHSSKVMQYSLKMCMIMKMEQKDMYLVKNAALLHDIGKIGVDQTILNKKGRLTVNEWVEVQKHPLIGAEIIEQTGFLKELIPIVKYHHSRFNGGGYPDPRLSDEEIPIGARIISIADAYDAMTSPRPYRNKPLEDSEALSELEKNSEKQFDPELVKIFVDYMRSTK